jgi:hypothetical protein
MEKVMYIRHFFLGMVEQNLGFDVFQFVSGKSAKKKKKKSTSDDSSAHDSRQNGSKTEPGAILANRVTRFGELSPNG